MFRYYLSNNNKTCYNTQIQTFSPTKHPLEHCKHSHASTLNEVPMQETVEKSWTFSAMRSWLAWDRAPWLFFSLSLFFTAYVRCGACMHAWSRLQDVLRNLQAPRPAFTPPARPPLYVSKAAWHRTPSGSLVALPFTLSSESSLSFSFFPIHGCRCSSVHIHGSRPTVSHQCWRHDRQIPRDACLDMFSVCFRADLNAERPPQFWRSRGGSWHEAKIVTGNPQTSCRGTRNLEAILILNDRIYSIRTVKESFWIYLKSNILNIDYKYIFWVEFENMKA